MPDDIGQVTSEHIRAFLAAERTSRAFAQHHRNPEVVKPFFTQAEITALLRACIGQDFESRGDAAIIRILADTGARVSCSCNYAGSRRL